MLIFDQQEISAKLKICSLNLIPILSILMVSTLPSYSYPEYQAFVEKNSKKTVDCAMCHINSNGPIGTGPGQVGSLTDEERQKLNEARQALEPGQQIESPILNKFGNLIIEKIGKAQFLKYKDSPEKLANALDDKSDLDRDGIADSAEYLDGTDPLNELHGDPFKLLIVNLAKYKTHILLAALAVFLLDYGFAHLIRAFYLRNKSKDAK